MTIDNLMWINLKLVTVKFNEGHHIHDTKAILARHNRSISHEYLLSINFRSLEVVYRDSETKLQVTENLN